MVEDVEGCVRVGELGRSVSDDAKGGEFGAELVDGFFDFFELGFGDVGAALPVLAHEGVVDADVAGEGTDVDHGVVFEEGGYVELEMGLFRQDFGYGPAGGFK